MRTEEDIREAHERGYQRAQEWGLTDDSPVHLYMFPDWQPGHTNGRMAYHPATSGAGEEEMIAVYQRAFKADNALWPGFIHEYTHRNQAVEQGADFDGAQLNPMIEIDACYTEIAASDHINDDEDVQRMLAGIRAPGVYLYGDTIAWGVQRLVAEHRHRAKTTERTAQEIYNDLRPTLDGALSTTDG